MADESVYRKLQQRLDRMPVGFPATESGVEIRILRRLFSEEEARVALALSMMPEPAAAIRKRLAEGMKCDTLVATLDRMAERGLIQKRGEGLQARYGKMMFVLGIYEMQLDRQTPELARDVLEYMREGFGKAVHRNTPQMRTIPVNQAINAERGVARYDHIREFVENCEGPFGVMNCVCRQSKDLVAEPCKQTEHRANCLTIGMAAQEMNKRGVARLVSRSEMLGFLDQADRDGLVLQPQNTQNPMFVCCCCGCCCGVLTTAKMLPRPTECFSTNHYAEVNAEICQVCGTCVTRCQMEAVDAGGESARVDLERCIGCGLCVTTCPSGAIQLRQKEKPSTPPKDANKLYLTIYRERFGTLGVARTLGRSVLGLQN